MTGDQRTEIINKASGIAGCNGIWPPKREEDILEELRQKPNGDFVLSHYKYDEDDNLVGACVFDLTHEAALQWWFKNFVPPEIKGLMSTVLKVK